MILGVSQYQVPLIETARDLGLKTYGVSIRGDYPGIPLVDVFLEADITDPDVVLDLAKKYHVDGVVSAPPYCSPIGHSFPMDLEEDLAVQLEDISYG